MKFEVGKEYFWNERGFPSITVLKRTPKMILVTNGGHEWRMRIRLTDYGDEYVVDSLVPRRYRGDYTCCSSQ